jgi:hypothetical protein
MENTQMLEFAVIPIMTFEIEEAAVMTAQREENCFVRV